jgi:hypothetical protein
MRNGLALPLLFAASVGTSVLATRLITAASNDSQRPSERHERSLTAPTSDPRATPAVSQRVWLPSPAPLPSIMPAAPSPTADPSSGSEDPGRVDLEKVLFEAEQKYELDGLPDAQATRIKGELKDALARSLAEGTALESVECKLKTCRAVVSSGTVTARESTLNKLGDDDDGPFAKYGFIIPSRETTAEGRSRAIVFVNMP